MPVDRVPVDELVDWDLAARTAARVARPGPVLGRDEAEQLVGELRAAARPAVPHVAAGTKLAQAATPGAADDVLVVDRATWARINARGFRGLLEPVAEEAVRRRAQNTPAVLTAFGSRVTGLEVGGLLGFLSSRVLGQFDAFAPDG